MAQQCGFTLREIRNLLVPLAEPERPTSQILELVERRRNGPRLEIQRFQEGFEYLSRMVARWQSEISA